MNKNPDVEVKLARYEVFHHDEDGLFTDSTNDGEFYKVADVDPLLESKDKRIQELEDGLRHYSECRTDSCTCGDGWSHDAARTLLSEEPTLDALSKTGGEG